MIRILELSVPPPDLWGGERGWRLSSVTNGQRFNQLCICNEASLKTQKAKVWRVSGLVNRRRFWDNGMPGEGIVSLSPFSTPCPVHLFYLAVPELYPFIINW